MGLWKYFLAIIILGMLSNFVSSELFVSSEIHPEQDEFNKQVSEFNKLSPQEQDEYNKQVDEFNKQISKQVFPYYLIEYNASTDETALARETALKEFSPDFQIVEVKTYKLGKNFEPDPEVYTKELYDTDFTFDNNVSKELLIQVLLESNTLSKFGKKYLAFITYKVSSDKITQYNDYIMGEENIGTDNSLSAMKSLVQKFENNKIVQEFLSSFHDTEQTDPFSGAYSFTMKTKDEKYWFNYSPYDDSIENYALPKSFSGYFPEMKEFVETIEREGCKIQDGSPIYFTNELKSEGRTIIKTEIEFDIEKGCVGNRDPSLSMDTNYRIVKKTPQRAIGDIIFGLFAGIITSIGFVLNLFDVVLHLFGLIK